MTARNVLDNTAPSIQLGHVSWYNEGTGMVADEKVKGLIQRLVAKIRDAYQPERIILYGSFAYGRPVAGSDIDLLIIKKTDERPLERRVRVRRIADIRDPACPPFSFSAMR